MNNRYEFFFDLLYQLFDILLLWYFKCTRQRRMVAGNKDLVIRQAAGKIEASMIEHECLQVMERLVGTLRKHHILPIGDQAWGWG